ncbi:hypothetical protein BDE02_10G170000 [Populus trichocarpa]|nr:hypothetical protein BDE02_10G170000 [Populus trichocarpa]
MPHEDGLPGALVTALILGSHELSRILVAKSNDVKLGVPYFVPSWQLPSHDFFWKACKETCLSEAVTFFWCYHEDNKYRAQT